MERKSFAAWVSASLICVGMTVVAGGCGGGSAKPDQTAQNDETSSAAQQASPVKVVEKFLSSLRDGDHELTVSLLTEKAVEETAKHGFSLNQIGTPTLEFQVGKTQQASGEKDRCQVPTNWSESSGAGSYEIKWVLKKTSNGWKIAGMTTPVFVGEPPIVFDFENGEDFLRKWTATDEEIAKREQTGGSRQTRKQDYINKQGYK